MLFRSQPGVTPADFATFLRVMDQVAVLPQEHPQHTAARRASSGLFKAAKKHRRGEKRRILAEAGHPLVTLADTMDGGADTAARLAHAAA